MNSRLARAVGEARDRLHGRLSARRAVAGAAVAAIPAAALAAGAVGGLPGWLAPACVALGAAAGAAWGALSRVSMADAAVALDRAVGAGDRLASAYEISARGPATEIESRLVADGVVAVRPCAFAWTFRRRDALGALAGAAFGLLALAAPAEKPVRHAATEAPRIVGEESDRLARSAAEAAGAAEKSGSREAAEAAKAAQDLAARMPESGAGKAAADVARLAAELRATIAGLRSANPEAARALERLADRLEAGGARLSAVVNPDSQGGNQAGNGSAPGTDPLPHADTAFQPVAPADPVALEQATWPAEYDAVVTHYFSEERK